MTQLQLFLIKLIVVRSGGNHPDLFVSLVPLACQLYTGGKCDDMVSINAMLLVGELVAALRVEVLSQITEIVPPIIENLSQAILEFPER